MVPGRRQGLLSRWGWLVMDPKVLLCLSLRHDRVILTHPALICARLSSWGVPSLGATQLHVDGVGLIQHCSLGLVGMEDRAMW